MRDLWWCEVCGSWDAPSQTHISLLHLPLYPPLTLHTQIFTELLTQIQQNQCRFSGGGNAHCGIPTFHSMAYEKNLKKRHTLNFLASILTKDLTRGWHLAGIKHASLI